MVQLYEVQTDTDVGIRWVGSYSFFNRIRNGKRAICQSTYRACPKIDWISYGS